MALLEVSNLGIAFGGLQAVAQLDRSIEIYTLSLHDALPIWTFPSRKATSMV